MPFNAAVRALGELKMVDFQELRGTRKPHPLVRLTMDAMCILFEVCLLLAAALRLWPWVGRSCLLFSLLYARVFRIV